MENRVLGNSGIEVSPVGMGCMGLTHAYGAPLSDDAAARACGTVPDPVPLVPDPVPLAYLLIGCMLRQAVRAQNALREYCNNC